MGPLSGRCLCSLFALITFFVFAGNNIYAQDLSSNLSVDQNVIKGKLPNGLCYYIQQNQHPAHYVELRLVVKAGSILEDEDQQGLAHFLEHMNFNGTVNFPKNELVSFLQTIGVKFGADINANTSFDNTIYRLSLPADSLGNLEKGFQVLEDWAHNALLTDADIDAERGVVLEESRLHKGAAQRSMDQYFPQLVSGSRYAQRIPIGKDSIIRNFKYEAVRRFYKDWYRPDLMAVVVVGDIDTSVALNMIRKHFLPLTNPQNERPHFYVDIPARREPDAMVIRDKEATNGHLAIIYPFVKKQETITINDYLATIKRSLIVAMINQRMADVSHNARTNVNSNYASFFTHPHGYEAFEVYCSFSSEYGPGGGIRFLTRELLRINKYGFNQSEYDVVRKELMSKIENEYAERNNQTSNSYVTRYVSNFTDNTDISGVGDYYLWYRQFLPSIELNELNTIVKEWIQSPNIFVLATAPDKPVSWPTGNAVLLKMTQDGFYQSVEPIKEKEADTVLMEDKPRAGKIVATNYERELQATTYNLSNGIRVTIKSTHSKNDEIILTGIKLGGKNNYDADDKNNCMYLEPVTQAMGFGDFKSYEIYKVISDKNIKVTTVMNDITDVVSGTSDRKDFEHMMQLLYLQLTKPRKDVTAFKQLVKKSQRYFEDLYGDPDAYFKDTISKALYNNDPLAASLPKRGDLEDIDLKRMLRIYKDEFSYADGYHFFIVGNVDTNVALPLIETYLGGLQESGRIPVLKDNGLRPVAGIHKMIVHKGKEQKSKITGLYYGCVPFSENLELNAFVLTEILNIKITEHLREEMGAIYTGGFSVSVKKEPYEHYKIELNLPCGPENVDKLLEAVNKEIKFIKENGPAASDLEKVKSHLWEKHKIQRSGNHYWMTVLENTLFWNKNSDNIFQYESLVNNITAADIQGTSRLLFDGKNEFTAILMPE